MDRNERRQFAEMVRAYNARAALPPCARFEVLRDGREIAGEDCRFTLGTVVLCEAVANPIFCATDGDINDLDIIEAYWLMQERNVNDAVWLAQDAKALRKRVSKYAQGFTMQGRMRLATELAGWIVDMQEALPMPDIQGDGKDTRRRDWYLDAVDILASEYGWSDEFILWRLPWVRNVRLRESIVARRNGRPIYDGVDEDLESMLTAARSMGDG